jgi:hypothetical protein
MDINLIGWSCDITDIFIAKLEELTGKKYTQDSTEEEALTVFTEEGQDIFNDLYDDLRTFFEDQLGVNEGVYELKIKVK